MDQLWYQPPHIALTVVEKPVITAILRLRLFLNRLNFIQGNNLRLEILYLINVF